MSSTEQGPPTPSLLSELHFVADKRTSQQCSGPTPSLRPPVLSRSVSVRMSDGCFLSALQPNVSRTAYVLPSDGPSSDPMAKARRVREQVRMRLAEKKSSSLPRLDDSLFGSTGEAQHAGKASDEAQVQTTAFLRKRALLGTHGFSSRSLIHTPSRIMALQPWQRPSKPQPGTVLEAKTRVWEEFSVAMEEDYIGRPSKKFWQTVRRLRRGKQYSANTVYSAGGELLTSTGDIVRRWKEYYEDLLNPPDTPSTEESGGWGLSGGLVHHPSQRCLRVYGSLPNQFHMCFVDLEKAFDRVPRGILWGVLQLEYGVRGPFAKECGVQFGNHRISSLLFADDIVLLASSNQDLQHVLGRFAAECEVAGMRISTSKSEAMVLDRKRVVCPLRVGGEVLASSGGVQVSRGGMSHREEALGKTQDTLERLCLSAGLGKPQNPPGRAGGSVRGEGSLGNSAQTAASATQISRRRWMDGCCSVSANLLFLPTLPNPTMQVPTVPLHSSGFSSRSAVETSSKVRAKGSSMVQSSFQTSQLHRGNRRSKSLCQTDQEAFPLTVLVPSGNASYPITMPLPGTLRRSLSGTLAQEKGYWQEEELPYEYTYKGPSHRTISRIANRQQHYQQQSSAFGQEGWIGTGRGVSMAGDGWRTQWQQHVSRANHVMGTGQYQAPIHRAASLHSVRSVGKGVDVLDGASIHSNDPLEEMQGLDIATAVRYLSESDAALQALGAAYIQHQCYHSNDAKNQVHALHGVPALVQLFSSDNQDVQRYATGAMRNLIYENAKNKAALVDAGGVMSLVRILKEPDEELRKTITGSVLWNLSSRDNLKEKLSKEALPELTEKVLIPLCSSLPLSPSERDIFYNTTGCLRNLSSVNERTRQKMRDMQGLVDSLVSYIQQEERGDDKGLENSLCVMRNLSYQLYMELPPSVRLRLEGPVRASASGDSQAISCFTLYSKKNTKHNQNQFLLSEVTQQPRGAEWLWHPKMVVLYKLVLQNSDCNSTSQEAAIGALQNITAGENRWSSVLSGVVMERERMLPILLDLLDTNSDMQQRPLTGLLKNLARHSTNKDHIAKNMVNSLVSKLPSDGLQKTPSSEVVVNICGALNHLVICSSLAARDIVYYNGLQKLVGIKTSHDNSPGSLKAARAASTVLCNMFQYNKLHKDYKLVRPNVTDTKAKRQMERMIRAAKGFARRDFTDSTI
ncbi:hypothetical protein L3Q82_009155 [Scortum barcoo]|uniref:Uncharacterized protein n=1 Tax=Scortum barcoo TaxID=214431 RepID=A0ACB8XBB6_9TELE|nr:hypothetical protein L3Q82_009155 [Scortum barcoo]